MPSTAALPAPTRQGLPPGPWSGPLGLRQALAYRRDPLGHLEQLQREYGDVAHSKLGPCRHSFLVGHPDHVTHVLVKRKDAYGKDPLVMQLRSLLGEGLLLSSGQRWMRQRRLMAPFFTPRYIACYAESMVAAALDFSASWQPGQVRNVTADMSQLTLEVALRTLFGTTARDDARRVGEAFAVVSDYHAAGVGGMHLPLWLPTPGNRAYRRARDELERVVFRIIRERRAAPQPGDDLLGRFLSAQGEDSPETGEGQQAMSDTQLRDEVLTLLLAGHETTALLLGYTWYLLGQNPQVRAQLSSELSQVLGGRPPPLGDRAGLPGTHHNVLESLRLYPPVAVMGREALEPDVIEGWEIPRGSLVFMSQWVIQRDERWFPQPERFLPERWSDAFRAGLPRGAYFPFGAGKRVCIGEAFALMEARLILATLAQRMYLEPLPAGRPLRVVPLITLRPVDPLEMRVGWVRAREDRGPA